VPGEVWRPICEEVARFARVLSYDRANLGRSDPAPKPRTVSDMAADLAALLAEVSTTGPFVLVGASFGSLIVRLYAAQRPKHVAGMVLVDSTLPEQAAAFERLVPRSEGESEDLRRLRAMVTTTDPETHPEGILFEESLREVREASPPGGLGHKPLLVLSRGLSIRYEFPTLPADMVALLDAAWLERHRGLAGLSTRGVHQVAKKSGHTIDATEPELVVAAIRRVVEAARGGS
jgi:pimeloyl-ACP methyl ester carboxylesterase